MAGSWRRRRRLKKVKPGDGRPLRPYRRWHGLWRSVFEVDLEGHRYALDVDHFDLDGRARLYLDGRRHAVAEMPAAFPVPGGAIEAESSTYGLKRAHLVLDDGTEYQLRPVPHSPEAWRADLGRRSPGVSKALAGGAITVLVVALVLGLPQLAEQITAIPAVAERVGTVTAPITLPAWLNTALTVGGVLAGLERALTLRYHWLIDGDTGWFGE